MNNPIIPVIIALIIAAIGVLNIALWYFDISSIYSLVYGAMSIILAWFVYHFRRRK